MKFLKRSVLMFSLVAVALSGCSSDHNDYWETRKRAKEADAVVGYPSVVNFTEAKLANILVEMRDEPNIGTYTYLPNRDGQLVLIGQSIGYGIPYGVQITNPQKSSGIPQEEPNALFVPDNADATWVFLVDPVAKIAEPVMMEPRVIVSPFPLPGTIVPDQSMLATLPDEIQIVVNGKTLTEILCEDDNDTPICKEAEAEDASNGK